MQGERRGTPKTGDHRHLGEKREKAEPAPWGKGCIISLSGLSHRMENIPFVPLVATVLLVALGSGGCLVAALAELEEASRGLWRQ